MALRDIRSFQLKMAIVFFYHVQVIERVLIQMTKALMDIIGQEHYLQRIQLMRIYYILIVLFIVLNMITVIVLTDTPFVPFAMSNLIKTLKIRKNMKIQNIMIGLSLLAVCMVSCTSEETVNSNTGELRVSTYLPTRSVITGSTLTKGDQIGVFALTADGNAEYATGSSNMLATTNDGVNWNFPSAATHLTTSEAKTDAYYPYSSGNTLHQVDVDIRPQAATGQNDYLYGASVDSVNIKSPEAKINFKFALSRITLNFKKGKENENDNIVLNNVKLSNASGGTAISTSGTMDITTGDITNVTNTSDNVYENYGSSLDTGNVSRIDLVVIPTAVNNDVVLSVTVNNKTFTVPMPSITWAKGCQYSYPVTFTGTFPKTAMLSIGEPVITAWDNTTQGGINVTGDNENKSTDTLSVGGTVGNMVDLGLSVKWADHNVGATNPEDYGAFFSWGETETKSDYSTSKWEKVSYASLQSQGVIDSNGNLTATYDAATVNWGKNWRMPTKAEQDELRTKCTWTWTTTSNGIHGYKVVGTNGNSIFLPAAGSRSSSNLYGVGSSGN